MAQVRDYMGYLEERYGFAPVNSQEEVFAAQTIAEVLEEHKLSTTTEEFSAPAWGKRIYGLPMIGLFIAAILFFFTGMPRTVGVALLFLCAALLVVYRLQIADPLSNLGPKAQSQNVVAVRPASGVAQGERPGRPIVVLAHYDTGREELLASPSLSPWRARITQAATFTVPAVVLLALISLIPVVPTTARYVLVALALVAAIPTLIWGISDITALTGPLTAGSVDNKSSVAAMLSIADKVCYGVAWHPDRRQLRARSKRDEEAAQAEEAAEVSNEEAIAALEAERAAVAPEPAVEEAPLSVPEPPAAVRHGADLIRELGILPESCEIVYVEPEPEPEPALEPEAPAEPQPEPETLYFDDADDDYDDQYEDDLADGMTTELEPEPQVEPADEFDDWGSSDFDIDTVQPTRRNAFFDLPDPSVAAVDPLSMRRSSASSARNVNPNDFAAEDFQDGAGSMNVSYSSAQAGAAYDDDQFETPAAAGVGNFEVLRPNAGMSADVAEGTRKEYKRGAGVLSKLFGRRDDSAEIPRGNVRAQDSMADWLGVDDEFDVTDDTSWDLMDDGSWKGGAARSDKLRFVPLVEERTEPDPLLPEEDDFADIDDSLDEAPLAETTEAQPVHKDPSATVNDIFAEEEAAAEEEAMRSLDAEAPADVDDEFAEDKADYDAPFEPEPEPSASDYNEDFDYELREAITAMGDADLQSHDIWFVAVGASELDHAGTSEFIEAHRKELRGAFIINLSCVGAGDTTVITDEGIVPHRRSDRRLVRHILASADDLHIPVSRASITWGDTDAMAVMRRSMRAATIMGCSTQGVPALSHTRNDLPGTPDKRLIADVVELVAETIRRA